MPQPAKHPDQRRRRNVKASARHLTSDGRPAPLAPKLAEDATYGLSGVSNLGEPWELRVSYGDAARAVWDTLVRDPVARAYTAIDWHVLRFRWLPLFDQAAERGDRAAFGEARQLERQFGLSPAARNSLDWTVDPTIVGDEPHTPTGPRGRAGLRAVPDYRDALDPVSADGSGRVPGQLEGTGTVEVVAVADGSGRVPGQLEGTGTVEVVAVADGSGRVPGQLEGTGTVEVVAVADGSGRVPGRLEGTGTVEVDG